MGELVLKVVKESDREVWDVTVESKQRFESTTFPPRSTMFQRPGGLDTRWIVSAKVKDAEDSEGSKASDKKTVEDKTEQKEETVIRIETKAEVKEDIEELVEKVKTTLMSTKLKDAEDEDSDDSERARK